jgi:hypothetical protein
VAAPAAAGAELVNSLEGRNAPLYSRAMFKGVAWVCAAALLASAAAPRDIDLLEAVADHDHHPGLGHPAEGDGDHAHGDADDHHDTPDGPCHHHESHTCCATVVILALETTSTLEPCDGAVRVRPARVRASLRTFVVELMHVPLG